MNPKTKESIYEVRFFPYFAGYTRAVVTTHIHRPEANDIKH